MVIEIADAIKQKIDELEQMRKMIKPRMREMVMAKNEYEKRLACVLIDLKNDVEYELDGRKIKGPPATIMEKLAKGICYLEKIKADEAEGMYKSVITNVEIVEAELNGFQSLNRHLDRG